MSDARAVVVLDRVHEDVGHLGPLYGATASEEGLWVGGASAYGRPTLLFSPDGVQFEPRTPPGLYQHRTLLALPDGRPDRSDFEVLSVAEAVRRYPPLRTFCEYNEPDVVRLYLGDLLLDRYETPDDLGNRSLVIVDGDLWTEHQVELEAHADDDDRLGLFVTGNLSARGVWLHGDPELHVGGDLEVTDLVVCGGGSEGTLDVGGALRARALAAAPWTNVRVSGAVDAIVVDETGGVDKTKGRRFAARRVLLPGYVNDNDDPDLTALRAAIGSGVDALRDTLAW